MPASAMLCCPIESTDTMQNGTRLAAIDLGSNSFRLEIGYLDHGQIQRTEYLKETVRQGNGLDENRYLSRQAMQRGWDCLARFGERLAGFRKSQVRAVATQTLREARNRDEFLARANDILGFPIDVISGREEARLIYQGVAHLLPQSQERRLVVDIGGRSTELILGQAYQAHAMESFRVGSVAWSMRYFAEGLFTAKAFETAEVAAQAVLDEALNIYRPDSWDVAYGSSGTVGAVGDVLAQAGWPPGCITREGLDWLRERLLKAQNADKVRLEGMKEDRRAVIGGGISVLRAVFDLLAIQEMQVAQGALRHGALYDLLDREQAQIRLECPPHELERHLRKLAWAAQLHEIGSLISHSDYHKHGAYILDNADAAGFTMPELHRLSLLVLGHRGKLRKLETQFEDDVFMRQLLCLRLAVLLCQARRDPDLQGLQLLSAGAYRLSLRCRSGWRQAYPQSAHLLQEELLAWQKTPWTLVLEEGS